MNLRRLFRKKPRLMEFAYSQARFALKLCSRFVRVEDRTAIFVSFGGRNYDDSPRALYEKIRGRKEFEGWKFYWGLKDPDRFDIEGARVVRFGSFRYWKRLLSSRLWITNGGIDRGINLTPKGRIIVNTWHGTPIKKIEGEENKNSVLARYRKNRPTDYGTIRCCQSEYDREILARVFNAGRDCFLACGLPRNDSLLRYSRSDIEALRRRLGIDPGKKILLYMPTYREYEMDAQGQLAVNAPITLSKWEARLKDEYVLLVRAHYAVTERLDLARTDFAMDVSDYSPLNDLYAMADILISDYSSSFFDYALLGRPELCFAYDLEKYEEERGFYITLDELPCEPLSTEEAVIEAIVAMDYERASLRTGDFAKRYIPNEGHACEAVIDAINQRLQEN